MRIYTMSSLQNEFIVRTGNCDHRWYEACEVIGLCMRGLGPSPQIEAALWEGLGTRETHNHFPRARTFLSQIS